MLRDLANGERTVSQLAEPFAISLAAASKHIKVLENAGLIRREMRGRTHLCRLDPGPLASAHEWLSFYERFWTDRLDMLERLLREEDAAPRTPHTKRRRHMTRDRDPRSLWRADRASHVDDPAPAARADRARLGLSHRERAAPQMARRRRDGDEGRRTIRTRLAQRRTDRIRRASARPGFPRSTGCRAGSPRSIRRASSLHLGRQRRRVLRAGTARARRCCSP